MDHLTVKEVINKIGNGVTDPLWCLLSDDTYVAFKTFGNPEGTRSLINEWVGYHLAKALGLKIPSAGFAMLDNTAIVNDDLKSQMDKPWNKYLGLGFYSETLGKAVQVTAASVLNQIINPEDLSKIILFDILIGNNDRNPGNLLMQMRKGPKTLYIIDHTHIFELGPIWDHHQLTRLTNEGLKPINTLKNNMYHYAMFYEAHDFSIEELDNNIKFFNQIVTCELIESIIDSVPREYQLSIDDKQALINYLITRLQSLPCAIEFILKGGTL